MTPEERIAVLEQQMERRLEDTIERIECQFDNVDLASWHAFCRDWDTYKRCKYFGSCDAVNRTPSLYLCGDQIGE